MSIFEYLDCIKEFDWRAEIVLRHGRAFSGNPLPKGYRHGRIGVCYANSFRTAIRKRITYVEGFADIGFGPMLHAWCVDAHGKVIDRTWCFNGKNEYFGIPIKPSYLKKLHRCRQIYGVIDRWDLMFPIRSAEPTEFVEPLVFGNQP